MYDWQDEIKGHFENNDGYKLGESVAVSRLNREIEEFLIEKAIPAIYGLKDMFAAENRFMHIDKNKQAVTAAVRIGDTTEFLYEIRVKKFGSKACAVRVSRGSESIIEPQYSKNDNSINSLTVEDIRSSFVFEYIASTNI